MYFDNIWIIHSEIGLSFTVASDLLCVITSLYTLYRLTIAVVHRRPFAHAQKRGCCECVQFYFGEVAYFAEPF